MKIVLLFTLLCALESCVTFSDARTCQIENLKSHDGDFAVDTLFYHSEKPSEKTILIMPPTGGTNYIDKRYAKNFCGAGFDVYILNSWSGMDDSSIDLELHQRAYIRAQKAVSFVLKQVSSPFIGMLGTSLGGLHAAVSASFQPRISALFIIVAGAPITEVITTSDEKEMQDLFAARQKKYGFKDRNENRRALEKVFTMEPMGLGDGYKNKVIGMSVATADSTVPTLNQEKLAAYLKPKKIITLSSSHFWGIVKTWLFHSDEILVFFEENAKGT